MTPFSHKLNVPSEYFRAFDFLITKNERITVSGEFTAPVWCIWMSPSDFVAFTTGKEYTVVDARHGDRFSYGFAYNGERRYLKFIVWNNSPFSAFGEISGFGEIGR
jgi:hypothetical protein